MKANNKTVGKVDSEKQSQVGAVDDSRRSLLKASAAVAAAATAAGISGVASAATPEAEKKYADPKKGVLPPTKMKIDTNRTALVVVDPQIDFLSPNGTAWPVVGKSVEENQTVSNIESMFKVAKEVGMPVLISPHYYYPWDNEHHFGGPLEKVMHNLPMFVRKDPLSLDGFEGSGADWMPEFKKYINDGKTIVCSPHKVYSLQQNDLNLQMRKIGIDKVILCGMSANLCVQAHLYEMLELGYEVAVVRDATAAAQIPEGDGYMAALINYRMVANDLWWTKDAVEVVKAAYKANPPTMKDDHGH
ncbi:cysteine hydrolase [Vibrio ishigakensis]|nr:cysteine hydrolase [Vibrio ishigakensis]